MTGERVLLVDDSDVLRKLVAGLLAEHGFVPVEAESAEQALRVALTDPPDIAIVDQHLPGLSGAHLVQQLRASGEERLRTLPVIGLSGRVWAERDLMAAGACCFVRKPVEVPALVHALRWALEVYRPPIAAG
jgi:CheY-like chemotaxis protein